MQSNNNAYYLHHLGLSNWQLQVPDIEHSKLDAQYSLLPKNAKYIFVVASPFDVASQLEQFLISVAYSLKLKGNDFGYLIFNVNQSNNHNLELDLLRAFIDSNHLKLIIIGQESTLSNFNDFKKLNTEISVLKLGVDSILQTSVVKKELMKILIELSRLNYENKKI